MCWIFPDPCLTGDSGLLGPSLTSPPHHQDKDRAQVPQGERGGGGEPRPHSATLPLTSGCHNVRGLVTEQGCGVTSQWLSWDGGHRLHPVLGVGCSWVCGRGAGSYSKEGSLHPVPVPLARPLTPKGDRQSALSGPQGCLSGSGPGMCKRGPFYGKPISLDSEPGPTSPLGSWEP